MSKQLYEWTEAQDAVIREVYRTAHGKKELSAALSRAEAELGRPRCAVLQRAQKIGQTRDIRKPWRESELSFLRANMGQMSVRAIARALKRTTYSVHCKVTRQELRRERRGYHTRTDVRVMFGITWNRLDQWIRLGWIGPDEEGFYADAVLLRFITTRPEAFDPRTLDVAWLRQALGVLGRRMAELDRYRAEDYRPRILRRVA